MTTEISAMLSNALLRCCLYFFQTEFEIRAVSYGSSFFSVDLWPMRFRSTLKNEDP